MALLFFFKKSNFYIHIHIRRKYSFHFYITDFKKT